MIRRAAAIALLALAALLGAPRAALAQEGRAPESRTLSADEIVRLVEEGLASEDAFVAEKASDELLTAGPRAFVKVVGALGKKHPFRRRRAATLLGRMGDPAAVGPLGALMGDTRGDDPLKLAAASALLALGSKEGVAPLIELLESGDRRTRLDAFLVLRRYTHHAFNFEYDGPAGARATSVSEWRAFWTAERARFTPVEPTSPPERLPPGGPLETPVPRMPPPPVAPTAPAPTATARPVSG